MTFFITENTANIKDCEHHRKVFLMFNIGVLLSFASAYPFFFISKLYKLFGTCAMNGKHIKIRNQSEQWQEFSFLLLQLQKILRYENFKMWQKHLWIVKQSFSFIIMLKQQKEMKEKDVCKPLHMGTHSYHVNNAK